MNKSLKKVLLPALAVVSTISIIACGELIPSKEMTAAKQSITKSMTVKADKYAPDELEAAKVALFKSHDYITENKLEEAKKSAEESKVKGDEAYNKAVVLLAQDTIAAADKSLAEADEVYAQQLAEPQFTEATKIIQNSRELFEAKNYYEAYLRAEQGDKAAQNAKEIALGKKDTLADSIKEVEIMIVEAKRYNAEEYFPDKYQTVIENARLAATSLDENKLKVGFSAVQVAKLNADELYLASLKKYTEDNITSAEMMLEEAGKAPGATIAVEEYNAAKEALANARKLYDDGRYVEALNQLQEVRRLSFVVVNTKQPEPVIEEKPVVTEPVTPVIEEKPVVVETKPVVEEEKDYTIYKVKYNPEKRDCLWRIAGKFYNNPRQWKEIYQANKDRIKNPNLLQPGWELKVPKKK